MPHKSHALEAICERNGWETQIVPRRNDDLTFCIEWNLYAKRGKETLRVTWDDNLMRNATYTYGENCSRRLNWRNQVVKLVEGKPNPRHLKTANTAELIETRSVPWGPGTPDDKILASLVGTTISYVGMIDPTVKTAMIPAFRGDEKDRFLRVVESPPHSGRKVVEWTDATGFHAVRLDSIVEVT